MKAIQILSITGLLAGAALVATRAQEQPPAPPQDPNKTYSLEAKYELNDLLKYKMDMDMKMNIKSSKGQLPLPGGGEMGMKMSAAMTMKTVGVKPDGTGVIVVKTGPGEMSMLGQTMPMPDTPPITEELDKHGKILKVSGLDKIPNMQMMGPGMNFNQMPGMGVILPEHPIKIGDTWDAEIPFPFAAQKAKVASTLVATETVKGRETLKIKQVWTIPFEMKMGEKGIVTDPAKAMMVMNGKMEMNTLVNVLEANARMVKYVGDMSGTFTMDMKGQAAEQVGTLSMDMKGPMSLELVSAGKVTPPAAQPAKPAGGATPAKKPEKKSP